jgi:hypothetical protein
MRAILAERRASGSYCISPEAEPEDWEDVREYAVGIQYLGRVRGMCPFKYAVRVLSENNGGDLLYLVDPETR